MCINREIKSDNLMILAYQEVMNWKLMCSMIDIITLWHSNLISKSTEGRHILWHVYKNHPYRLIVRK